MQRADVGGVGLQYEVRGTGDPVVFVHAGAFPDWFAPLLTEPALAEGYAQISYHRVGYGGSDRPAGPVSIADQAAHCRALMRYLGVERAHVVGHSSGANIALQLALDAPESVGSLAVMEATLMDVPGSREFAERYMAPVMRHYGAGEKEEAVDAFMRAVGGPDYRAAMDHALPPGYFERAEGAADAFFGTELTAVRQWRLAREDAERITQPVLVVLGGESDAISPIFRERFDLLLSLLPRAQAFELPGATHLLHVQKPRAMASELTRFFERHPL